MRRLGTGPCGLAGVGNNGAFWTVWSSRRRCGACRFQSMPGPCCPLWWNSRWGTLPVWPWFRGVIIRTCTRASGSCTGRGWWGVSLRGATRGRSIRWWVTQKGLDEIRLGGLAWQQPWALSQLLARLPPVEWFYQVAGSITSMGALQSFQWFSGMSWDAAVRYERAWAAFFWSGLLQVEVRLREVLAELAEDLREYSVGPGAAWPGLLVFVVTDGGSGS